MRLEDRAEVGGDEIGDVLGTRTCGFEGHGQKAGLVGDKQEHHGHQEALATLPWPGERAGEAFFRKLG